MKRVVIKIACAFLFGCLCVLPCQAEQSIAGEWIGGYKLAGAWTAVTLHFTADPQAIKGTIDIQSPDGSRKSSALTGVSLQDARLRFALPPDAGALIFEGRLKGAEIKGKFAGGEARGSFELLRVARLDPNTLQQYVGSYELSAGNFISIGRQTRTGTDARLGFVERASGRRGNLTPISETEFVSGPALSLDYPTDVQISFSKNKQGRVTGLKWKHGAAPEKSAPKLSLREEEVQFRNGEITLAGTLLLPPGGGPHPAVILVHGSTPLVRYYFGADPYMYPVYGIAVLFYDKRGVGASTGQRSEAITDLASDVLAGVKYLQSRTEIDPRQIGLFGHSQGGWVVPEAAARSKEIAFIVAGAASGLPGQENVLYEIDGELRYAGFSEAERAQARALYKLGNDVIGASGAGWNRWRAEIAAARDEKWFRLARTPNSLIEMNDANRARIMAFVNGERRTWYDPVPAWESITIPALVYESEWDIYVPARQSATIIEQALQRAGNQDYTVKLFPQSNHGQWAMQTDGPNNRLSHRVHYNLLFSWLLKHVTIAKRT